MDLVHGGLKAGLAWLGRAENPEPRASPPGTAFLAISNVQPKSTWDNRQKEGRRPLGKESNHTRQRAETREERDCYSTTSQKPAPRHLFFQPSASQQTTTQQKLGTGLHGPPLAGDSIRSCKFAASVLLVDATRAFLAFVDRSSVLGFFAWSLIRLNRNVIACEFWNVVRPDLEIG